MNPSYPIYFHQLYPLKFKSLIPQTKKLDFKFINHPKSKN
jgi:hypothetical protein